MPVTEAQDPALQEAIAAGKAVEIRGYTLTEGYQSRLDGAIRLVLDNYEKADLVPIISSVAQELALWASLANMRQVYFDQHGMQGNDPLAEGAHEDDFQRSITLGAMNTYREGARALGLFLRTRIHHSVAGIRLEVFSNAQHTERQEERLRRLLREAMNYSDVMEYFRDNPEDKDGRHLGLAFSILMLKEDNLRPELMRIGRVGDQVMSSRLEIPFDRDFRSIREQLMNDELPLPFEESQPVPLDAEPAAPEATITCPLCGKSVTERIFFQDIPPGMLDVRVLDELKPEWTPEKGACASCLAIYGLDV